MFAINLQTFWFAGNRNVSQVGWGRSSCRQGPRGHAGLAAACVASEVLVRIFPWIADRKTFSILLFTHFAWLLVSISAQRELHEENRGHH